MAISAWLRMLRHRRRFHAPLWRQVWLATTAILATGKVAFLWAQRSTSVDQSRPTLGIGAFRAHQDFGIPRSAERKEAIGCSLALAGLGADRVEDLGSYRIGYGEDSLPAEAVCPRLNELRGKLLRRPDLPRYRGRVAADDDTFLWWFLRDRRLNVDESFRKIERCLLWRSQYRVEKLGPELFAREVRMRKAYLHNYADVLGRPVLVAIAKRHNVMERKLEDSCQCCVWFMERLLDQLAEEPPPVMGVAQSGAVEQALVVFDLRGFTWQQADPEFVGFIIEALYNYYPSRVGRILFVEAPDAFQNFWETVRPLMGRYQVLPHFLTVQEMKTSYFAPGQAPPELLEPWQR